MKKRKTIMINSDDMPTVKSIVDTVGRLRKDHNLLSRMRGSSDVEDPVSFKSVMNFLEMLVKREKRKLPKEKNRIDNHIEIMIDIVGTHLNEMDDWEMRRNILDTDLKKVFDKFNHLNKDKETDE